MYKIMQYFCDGLFYEWVDLLTSIEEDSLIDPLTQKAKEVIQPTLLEAA